MPNVYSKLCTINLVSDSSVNPTVFKESTQTSQITVDKGKLIAYLAIDDVDPKIDVTKRSSANPPYDPILVSDENLLSKSQHLLERHLVSRTACVSKFYSQITSTAAVSTRIAILASNQGPLYCISSKNRHLARTQMFRPRLYVKQNTQNAILSNELILIRHHYCLFLVLDGQNIRRIE